jgi:hypothetical protein
MHVKIHPDLVLACLRQKRSKEYRLWSLARTYDGRGAGRVRLADLQAWLDVEDLRGLSPVSVKRLLRAGEGVFWMVYTVDGQRWLRLHGLASMCVSLGVDKLRRDPVLLPMRYARSLKSWRAAIYAAQFAGDDWSNPISRRVLAELTGWGARTQRNYQRAMDARMETRQNAALTTKTWERGDEIPEGHYPDYVGDEIMLLRRLPNSYRSDLRHGRRGMVRRVNKRLNARNSIRFCGMEAQERVKLFYQEQRAAQRRIQAMDEGDQFYHLPYHHKTLTDGSKMPTVRTSRCGAALWDMWRIADGCAFCG